MAATVANDGVQMKPYLVDQVQAYRKKFPKSAPYFPKYVPPAAPQAVAE